MGMKRKRQIHCTKKIKNVTTDQHERRKLRSVHCSMDRCTARKPDGRSRFFIVYCLANVAYFLHIRMEDSSTPKLSLPTDSLTTGARIHARDDCKVKMHWQILSNLKHQVVVRKTYRAANDVGSITRLHDFRTSQEQNNAGESAI